MIDSEIFRMIRRNWLLCRFTRLDLNAQMGDSSPNSMSSAYRLSVDDDGNLKGHSLLHLSDSAFETLPLC